MEQESLKKQIRQYFLDGNILTVLSCFQIFHTYELRSIVAHLRNKQGIDIKSHYVSGHKKRWKVYYLAEKK